MPRAWLLIRCLLLLLPTSLVLGGCPTDRGGDDDDSASANDEDLDGDGFCPGDECDDSDLLPNDCNDNDADSFPNNPEVCDAVDNNCDGRVDELFDVDQDGYFDVATCGGTYPIEDLDCNDLIATVNPGAGEACDGFDTDCNGLVDDGLDNDNDNFLQCGASGEVDCDDEDASVHPGGTEICDEKDNDCDGFIDNGPLPEFQDNDGDGFSICAGDCNDFVSGINPSAQEACDEEDNDCDGIIDEDLDLDGDGVAGPYPNCFVQFGVVDCDDNNPDLYPGNAEVCDGIDNNCDNQADENLDFDNDGYTSCDGDCDSLNASINPGAPELCDGIDNDCNGIADDAFDNDGDGISACGGDCNDTDPTIYPGATELCDAQDNDCDGEIGPNEGDIDGDGSSECDGDCDETDVTIHPAASEVCNAVDDDCDGTVPADELDTDLDGYIACTPAGCEVALVTDDSEAGFWSSFDALNALGMDLDDSFVDATNEGWMEDASNFVNSQVLVWYSGGRDITQAEYDMLEAWVQAGGGLVVTGPDAVSAEGLGGDDDDDATADVDDATADDADATADDDDSAVDDDDSAADDDDSAPAAPFTSWDWDSHSVDGDLMATLIRSVTTGNGPQTDLCTVSDGTTAVTNGPYGVYNQGFAFSASSVNHDGVVADTARGAVRVASVGNRAKVVLTETLGGGYVLFWNGNEGLGDWDSSFSADLGALLRNTVHTMNLGCGGALQGGDCDDADATLRPGTCP